MTMPRRVFIANLHRSTGLLVAFTITAGILGPWAGLVLQFWFSGLAALFGALLLTGIAHVSERRDPNRVSIHHRSAPSTAGMWPFTTGREPGWDKDGSTTVSVLGREHTMPTPVFEQWSGTRAGRGTKPDNMSQEQMDAFFAEMMADLEALGNDGTGILPPGTAPHHDRTEPTTAETEGPTP